MTDMEAFEARPDGGFHRMKEIRDEHIDPSVLERVSLTFVRKNLVMPLKVKDGRLLVALADHRSIFALNELERITGLPAEPVFVDEKQILGAINRFFDRLSGSAQEVIEGLNGESLDSIATVWEEPKDLTDLTDEAPIIRLLNSLLFQAAKDRASDIHIEPYERDVEVRFRVDGVLYPVLSPPKILQDALVSRVKIMAGLDIAEKRLPQDGKIRLLIAGKDIYVRVSIIPTSYGERIVLRLLDRKAEIIALQRLGLNEGQAASLERLLSRNSGIILVTGPTGSGKTTTLYSALNSINSTIRNIITIEDPVEYQLKGIGQVHVNPKIGLTFAHGLRSILRQDPDVIMVGEIRDRETAEIAIQASLTGHLVLSTLHTNDTASAVTRLVDMGIEPFLMASSLSGILAQRLVRVLCVHCKKEYAPGPEEAKLFKSVAPALWRPEGCGRCFNTGYYGRTGIFEFLIPSSDMRPMILKNQDSDTVKRYAVAKGMKLMMEDGIEKAASGITSLEEVLRVTRDEGD
ncbi:MAG: type II secretion system ATPase GspE [Deltaproteobacteria bacterium]|nr:type II secretion system ATPase GspE [Deltaproteobacteria bacterium]